MMPFYRIAVTIFVWVLASQTAFAKWDEERDVSTNGKDEFIYYYKTNDQGQKLVLDKYVKRLIFIQHDRLYKRTIRMIKVDGQPIEVMSDAFSRYPGERLTSIADQNKALFNRGNQKGLWD